MSRYKFGTSVRGLKVFISSPTDVEFERNEVERVIDSINRTFGEKLGILLSVKRWEKFRPTFQKPEKYIEEQLQDCDLFIMIFSRKFGSPPSTTSKYKSGTEMEFNIAYKLRSESRNNRPEIFAYFKKITEKATLADPGPKLKKILRFKDSVKDLLFYREYLSKETFSFELKDHLIEWLIEVSEPIDQKKEILQRFFALGAAEGKDPSARIIYPHTDTPTEDITHLLPHIRLEDFQAIHKVTKCLNIAGCENVKSLTPDLYDKDKEREHNKIFICVPNNNPALKCLEEIPNCKFEIATDVEEGRESHMILWRNDKEKPVCVKSPLSRYLVKQRQVLDPKWQEDPGRCFGIDFAVVARFNNPITENLSHLGRLKKLFIFGIRGLGTWGAAWYIDLYFKKFDPEIEPEQPFQKLLKVTYRNYRIRDIEDVSEQPQSFFDNELEDQTIQAQLEKYLKYITI